MPRRGYIPDEFEKAEREYSRVMRKIAAEYIREGIEPDKAIIKAKRRIFEKGLERAGQ